MDEDDDIYLTSEVYTVPEGVEVIDLCTQEATSLLRPPLMQSFSGQPPKPEGSSFENKTSGFAAKMLRKLGKNRRKKEPVDTPVFTKCIKQVTAKAVSPASTDLNLKERKRVKRSAKAERLKKRKLARTRAKTSRLSRKRTKTSDAVTDSRPLEMTLYDKLVHDVTSALRGKRSFGFAYVEWVAKVGSCPSAGGSRSPLAGIITQVSSIGSC